MTKFKTIKTIGIFVLMLLFAFGIMSYSKAAEKLYISNGNVYYACPGGKIAAPADLNIDIQSTTIINNRFFKDKNNVFNVSEDGHSQTCLFQKIAAIDPNTFEFLNDYFQKDKNNAYFSTNYWGWGTPGVIKNADVQSFKVLSDNYAKDKNKAYYASLMDLIITDVDSSTFEVLKEDGGVYAMDKNHMYYLCKIIDGQGLKITNDALYNSLKGKIILKVEDKGEAYYVSPNKKVMFFLSRPIVAFQVMREQGMGITNKDLEKISVADNYCPDYAPSCDKPSAHNLNFAKGQKGKIFLQVEAQGEAWYVNPNDSKRYFLGRPADAFNVMKNLGLGISNANFTKLTK